MAEQKTEKQKQSGSRLNIEDFPVKKEFGKITQEAFFALRDRIGVERARPLEDWEIEEMKLTRSRIRMAALAIGDYNPLYLDLEYARKSPHGTLIAPPTMMQHIEQINARTDGMPGMHALFRGITLTWRRPVRMGDRVMGKTYLRDVYVSQSQLSGVSVIQAYESIGSSDKGDEVCRVYTSWSRHERSAAAKSDARQKMRPQASYTPEEIERIKEDYRKEVRRGAQPRYWEDVQVGEELSPIIKGPTNLPQRMFGEGGAWYGSEVKVGGSGDWGVQHAQIWKTLFEPHPGLPYINEQGVPEVPVTIHNSNEKAQHYLGLPGGYDAGQQRINWNSHLMMNWAGDHGFLRKLEVKMPQLNIMGDTTWCKGRVTGKRVEGDKHIVEIEYTNENQMAKIVTVGTAEVVLLSKKNPKAKTWDD